MKNFRQGDINIFSYYVSQFFCPCLKYSVCWFILAQHSVANCDPPTSHIQQMELIYYLRIHLSLINMLAVKVVMVFYNRLEFFSVGKMY